MPLTYREDKATQAAALLLAKHQGRMSHMKLVKLLYFADRTALLRWGRPITFDWYYSLDHGPILSFTLNRLNEDVDPGGPSYWHQYISERQEHEVVLLRSAPADQLSRAEQELLGEIFATLGDKTQWQLRDLSHGLPEWQNPQGSRMPIEIEDILRAEGVPEEQVQEIRDALEAEGAAERLLG
jgi:uncharacterized phage-associated protein